MHYKGTKNTANFFNNTLHLPFIEVVKTVLCGGKSCGNIRHWQPVFIQIKNSTVDNYLRMERAGIDMIKYILAKEKGDESINDLKIDMKCETPVLHAKLTYLNDESLMDFADAIASNIWTFLVSKNGDFYKSDFPIVVEPDIKNVRPMYMGLAQYGEELTYPLSPSMMLIVFYRVYFKEKKNMTVHSQL